MVATHSSRHQPAACWDDGHPGRPQQGGPHGLEGCLQARWTSCLPAPAPAAGRRGLLVHAGPPSTRQHVHDFRAHSGQAAWVRLGWGLPLVAVESPW